jgi:transcriptional regulator with XRE-family HTH domain
MELYCARSHAMHLELSRIMVEETTHGFGERLALLRKSRGLTQAELGEAAGLSQRMVAHYENTPGAQPPASVVASLATALHASADELLGIQPLQEKLTPSVVRLRRRLRKAEALPPEDQKALLTLVEALLERRGVA